MSMKDKLLSKIDNAHSKIPDAMDDALFVVRQVCGLQLSKAVQFDDDTLLDMGRGTIEAMSAQDCMYVKWHCEKKGMQLTNG